MMHTNFTLKEEMSLRSANAFRTVQKAIVTMRDDADMGLTRTTIYGLDKRAQVAIADFFIDHDFEVRVYETQNYIDIMWG